MRTMLVRRVLRRSLVPPDVEEDGDRGDEAWEEAAAAEEGEAEEAPEDPRRRDVNVGVGVGAASIRAGLSMTNERDDSSPGTATASVATKT